jgi:oligoribonuclease (3'-5' exoribonuclease)
MLVFTDFETTGLDPDNSLPLELGIVVTSDSLEQTKERRRYLFAYDRATLDTLRAGCGYEGHEKSGLWYELYNLEAAQTPASGELRVIPLTELDASLCAMADTLLFRSDAKPQMAGFGVHFDQRILRRWAPEYLQCLHYRLRDVRTLAEEVRTKYGQWGPDAWGPHRALPDCDAAIRYLRWYRLHAMSPYGVSTHNA